MRQYLNGYDASLATANGNANIRNLHHLKLDSINIGIETAHDPTLERMNKGYHASDILEQLSKLDESGIRYNVFYLNGLGGKEYGICEDFSSVFSLLILGRLLLIGTSDHRIN